MDFVNVTMIVIENKLLSRSNFIKQNDISMLHSEKTWGQRFQVEVW